jgi:hypothetical protein
MAHPYVIVVVLCFLVTPITPRTIPLALNDTLQAPQIIQLQQPAGWSKDAIIGLCSIFVALLCCCVNLVWPSAGLWFHEWWCNHDALTCKHYACKTYVRLICVARINTLLSTRQSRLDSSTSQITSPALGCMPTIQTVETEQQQNDVPTMSPGLSEDPNFVHE